jgi:hypothetical protein
VKARRISRQSVSRLGLQPGTSELLLSHTLQVDIKQATYKLRTRLFHTKKVPLESIRIDMDMSYARVVRTASLTSYPVRCKM